MGSTLEALMKKRAEERLAAVERKWDGGRGSLVADFDPAAAALLPPSAKATRPTEELLLAAVAGDAAATYDALERGGDPGFVFGEAYGCRPGTGYTPLMAAAHRGHVGAFCSCAFLCFSGVLLLLAPPAGEAACRPECRRSRESAPAKARAPPR